MVRSTPPTSPLQKPPLPGPLTLPLALTGHLRLGPDQFAQLCAANPDAVLELATDGSLITMTPTGSETGGLNGALLVELGLALRSSGLPCKLFDSSTGFRLPDGSVRSPDASLVALQRWRALSDAERQEFAPLCPDLVVELASASDDGPRGLAALRRKMADYQANGARLGWLLTTSRNGWRGPPGWRGAKTSPAWRSSWRRSGQAEPGTPPLDEQVSRIA